MRGEQAATFDPVAALDPVAAVERRWLAIALATAAVAVAAAATLRVAEAPTDGIGLGTRLFAVLVAAALADVAVLSRARSPGVAWFAAALSTGIAVLEIVRALRAPGLVVDRGPISIALVSTVLALAVASAIAFLDAARRRSRPKTAGDRAGVAIVALAFAAVLAAGTWTLLDALSGPHAAAALGPDELAPVRITGRLALAAVGVGLAVGVLRDVQPGLVRGWQRWRTASAEGRRRSLVGHLADELLPWGAAAQTQAREDERAKLAADLHALVLPDLRKAAAAASEAAGWATAGAASEAVSETSSASVRRALEDVEQLMHGRQSIVLEEFGLVAALEWLAERTEQRSRLRVELQLDGEAVDRRASVPPAVARAAFRIALLALDNVERHARASKATIALRVERGLVELRIADDGASRRAPVAAGGRGLSDMRAEAAATGGSLRIGTEPTTVEATWRLR